MENLDSLMLVLSLQQNDISQLQDSVSKLQYNVDNLTASVSQMQSDTNTSLWGILLMVMLFAVLVYLYLWMTRIESRFRDLQKNLNGKKTSVIQPVSQIGDTSSEREINIQEQSSSLPQSSVNESLPTQQNGYLQPIRNQSQRKTVKYASIQEVAGGGLKIAERVMNDDTSKMFMVEMAEGDTTATYTFNPQSEASILSDLQTFKNFTEPFAISGTPRKVVEVKKGQLEKNGKFWLVKSKLQVDFEY